jgi:hypothetical protein
MITLRRLDDRLLTDVNDLARHTGWLHDAILGYATYGLVLFAGLMLAAFAEPRPTPPTRTCSCWPRTAPTPPSRVTPR